MTRTPTPLPRTSTDIDSRTSGLPITMRPAEGGWRAEGQCGKMPRGCNWPRSSMSDARKAMHTHTSFEAENEASKRLSDAFRVADSTRSEEYHEQYPQRFTMSARREEVGTAKQNATSNTHNDSPCLRDEKRWESAKKKEVQHVRLSLTPAVFSARHFSRRPSVASGGHIRTRRPGPQADSPQHSKDCTRAAPSCQPRNPSKDCAIRQSQSDTD